MNRTISFVIGLLLLATLGTAVRAQSDTGEIRIVVTDKAKKPIRFARVLLQGPVIASEFSRPDGEVQFTDALERMIQSGTPFTPYEVNGWYDCGKKETVLETNRHFLEAVRSAVSKDGCTIIPPVFIADSATVNASVIGPYVAISEHAVVESSVIKNSIIGPNAVVKNLILHDSLVGSNATLNGVSSVVNVGDSSETAFT